jgi:uncharacterized membrane protein YkvI
VSFRKSLKIALAFVGLLVGAGFATGQEVIQYFVSFGALGVWGAVISGILMTVAGAVIIQLGSYFLAEEHNMVFRHVAHPVLSKVLDVSITITLFAVGLVMLAGAGSTLEQQFGLPSWIGAGLLTVLVMVTGLLDVDKVSAIISGVTPLIIVAVIVGFVYTMLNLPSDLAALDAIATQADSPVRPWWLSALNYTGMALLLGVSMCLVIGGSNPNPREAGWGGVAGGALYTVLLLMAAAILYLNIARIGAAEVPMLELFDSMHPALGYVMVVIVFAMIYNTAIGMFYALGRRLTASHQHRYRPVFLLTCVAGYAVSFVGFGTLMSYVYPAIGYIGMVMIVVVVGWWLKERVTIMQETGRRDRIRVMLALREQPGRRFSRKHAARLEEIVGRSNIEPATITDAIEIEVSEMRHHRYREEQAVGAGAPAS